MSKSCFGSVGKHTFEYARITLTRIAKSTKASTQSPSLSVQLVIIFEIKLAYSSIPKLYLTIISVVCQTIFLLFLVDRFAARQITSAGTFLAVLIIFLLRLAFMHRLTNLYFFFLFFVEKGGNNLAFIDLIICKCLHELCDLLASHIAHGFAQNI